MLHSRTVMTCVGLLLVCGCGSEQYELRIKETNAFFEYQKSLDRVLQSGNWSHQQSTISMRIPKGFTFKPGPRPPKADEPEPEDTRQPNYLGADFPGLPGLVGAWQGEFLGDGGNVPVFLYVCSNHPLFLAAAKNPESAPDPALFLTNLEQLLSTTMQVTLPPGEVTQIGDNIRYAETCPKDPNNLKYALPQKFTGITFVPPGLLPGIEVKIKAQMYGHYNGPIQVAVLAIYPAGIRDRIEDKLLKSLETFSVSNQMPKLQSGSGAGKPNPGGSAF